MVLPVILGISLEWYADIDWQSLSIISAIALLAFFLSLFLHHYGRLRFNWISGFLLFLVMAGCGAILGWNADVRNKSNWIGRCGTKGFAMVVRLTQEPQLKKGFYHANSKAQAIVSSGGEIPVSGGVLLKWKENGNPLETGAILLSADLPSPIPPKTQPGGFDFQRYCFLQGITHQLFLRQGRYTIVQHGDPSFLPKNIAALQLRIRQSLKKFIPGKEEAGFAEALLIGYREDLDKNLVQSYANTGVVHIIAISGLHLGMLYGLLLQVCYPLRKIKRSKFLVLIIVLGGLWLFTLLAGASASVLRSAVMFSFIAIGNADGKKSGIYNGLCASAFFLLWIDPYFLWDLGFQLSYAAVLSIVIFMKRIYKWITLKNQLLDAIWKANAITLSAQILTLPICMYQFHQVPTLFLFSNALAVPLSGLILYAEIGLLLLSGFAFPAGIVGHSTAFLIRTLNTAITRLDASSLSLWRGLNITIWQLFLLYLFILFISVWIFRKKAWRR